MSGDNQGPVEALEAAITRQIYAAVAAGQTALAETVDGLLLRGARAVPVSNAKPRPTLSGAALVGYSLREVAGVAAAASVILRSGEDAEGEILAVIELAGDRSETQWFGPGGVNVGGRGLFVDVAAGAVAGVVYLRGTD